ncbi:MAG: hypothetical protein RBR77_09960 [Thauera sp.]|jgi:transcriptional regulator of met regulon|nr:hypothetical protein [Thauera sp.]
MKMKTEPSPTLSAAAVSPLRMLTGQALLDDMEAFRKEVTATPEAAREALRRIGVLAEDGKLKRLIHD